MGSTTTANNNFVGGTWVPSVSGLTFENRNPANTDDLIGLFQQSTVSDVDAAIDSVVQQHPDWFVLSDQNGPGGWRK